MKRQSSTVYANGWSRCVEENRGLQLLDELETAVVAPPRPSQLRLNAQ